MRHQIEVVPLLKHAHKVIHMEVVDISWSSLKVLHESGTVLSGAALCIGLLDRQQLGPGGSRTWGGAAKMNLVFLCFSSRII